MYKILAITRTQGRQTEYSTSQFITHMAHSITLLSFVIPWLFYFISIYFVTEIKGKHKFNSLVTFLTRNTCSYAYFLSKSFFLQWKIWVSKRDHSIVIFNRFRSLSISFGFFSFLIWWFYFPLYFLWKNLLDVYWYRLLILFSWFFCSEKGFFLKIIC